MNEPAPDLLTTKEFAAAVGLKPVSLGPYVKKGILPSIKVDGNLYFHRDSVSAIKAYRAQRTTPGGRGCVIHPDQRPRAMLINGQIILVAPPTPTTKRSAQR